MHSRLIHVIEQDLSAQSRHKATANAIVAPSRSIDYSTRFSPEIKGTLGRNAGTIKQNEAVH